MLRRKLSFLRGNRGPLQQTITRAARSAVAESLEGRTLMSITFGDPTENGGVPSPIGIVKGDFNEDGKVDVAVAGTSTSGGTRSGVVGVYLGNGNGTFGAPTLLADPGSRQAYDLVVADLNGDGHLDLAVTNPLDGTISVYLGKGDGTFQTPRISTYGTSQSGNSAVASIAVGQFGGQVSLVLTDPSDHQIDYLTNNGDGTFTVAQRFNNNNEANFSPAAIIASNFTNSGSASIAYSETNNPNVFVALWNGNGFSPATANPAGGAVQLLTMGDFNDDGQPDIVATTTGANVAVLLNAGGGTFGGVTDYSLPFGSPSALATGFFDNSSQRSIALMDGLGDLAVLAGNGHGQFTPSVNQKVENGVAPQRLIAGNFFGSSMQDLVYTELNPNLASGGGIAVLQAGGTPTGTGGGGGGGGGTGSSNSPLTATLTGKLPASIVAGTKIRINETLTLTNTGTTAIKGLVSGVLFLTSGTTSDSGSITLTGSHARKINLKPGKKVNIPVKLSSLPFSTPAGTYHLFMQVTDPNGHLSNGVTTATMSVAPAQIDLAGAFVKVPATATAGKKTSTTVQITNNGNVPAVGSLPVFVYASPTPSIGATPDLVASAPRKINIKPGKSVRITLNNLNLPAGSDYLVANIDPNNFFRDINLANNTFATQTPITVS